MSTTSKSTINRDLARRSLASSSHPDRDESTETKLPRLPRENSIREILYTTLGNFLKRRESSRPRVVLSQKSKEEKTRVEHQRMERRNSIQKSLDTFVDENEEDILKTIIASNTCSDIKKPNGRYLRRGSVTKHQIDPKVHEMQPNCRATRSENEDIDVNDAADRRRRYLRRGSVTKYVLDAIVDGLQPTTILEDSHNLPRRPLPPPPMKNCYRHLMANEEPVLLMEKCDNLPKHQIDPKVREMQPNCRATRSEDEDIDVNDAADRRRRYLRRGSVTKYVLDAIVDGLQPTAILEDSHNLPRRPLPPPPMKNSYRHLMANEEPVLLMEKRDNLPMKPTSRKDRRSKTKKNKRTKRRNRSVSFGMVTIIEFPLVLGHHPSVSAGAPTMLGKQCQSIVQVDVRILEKHFRTHSHRRGRKLALSVPERARRLFAAGYSLEEICEATKAVQRIKRERADSIGGQNWDRFHIFMESASRTLRTMVDVPPPALIRARMA
jgi:hypothetical protein